MQALPIAKHNSTEQHVSVDFWFADSAFDPFAVHTWETADDQRSNRYLQQRLDPRNADENPR